MEGRGQPWTLVSNGFDSVLVTPAFTPSLPRSARLLVRGDQAALETYRADGSLLSRAGLMIPSVKGSMRGLMSGASAFDSIMIIEEEGTGGRRHLYQAVVCIIPMSRPQGST